MNIQPNHRHTHTPHVPATAVRFHEGTVACAKHVCNESSVHATQLGKERQNAMHEISSDIHALKMSLPPPFVTYPCVTVHVVPPVSERRVIY